MPLHRRRLLHRRLAELDIDPEERARHLAIAAVGADEEIATALDCGGGRTHAHAAQPWPRPNSLSVRSLMTPMDALKRINRRRITAAEHCAYAGDAKRATTMLEKLYDALGAMQPQTMGAARCCATPRARSAPARA